MEINKMTARHKAAVTEMMRVFYASDAVLSNGSAEIFESDTEACIGDSPYLEGYVFEDGGELMGYAMVAKSFSTEFGKPCIWIEDLYLKPPFRAQGLAQIFFDWLFSRYPDAVFRLEVEEGNRPAVAAYQKSKFEFLPYLEMIKK